MTIAVLLLLVFAAIAVVGFWMFARRAHSTEDVVKEISTLLAESTSATFYEYGHDRDRPYGLSSRDIELLARWIAKSKVAEHGDMIPDFPGNWIVEAKCSDGRVVVVAFSSVEAFHMAVTGGEDAVEGGVYMIAPESCLRLIEQLKEHVGRGTNQ